MLLQYRGMFENQKKILATNLTNLHEWEKVQLAPFLFVQIREIRGPSSVLTSA
jgi:hypothetical protein